MDLNIQIVFISDTTDPEVSQNYQGTYAMVAKASDDFGDTALIAEIFNYFPQIDYINVNVWAAKPSSIPEITFNQLPAILIVNEDNQELIALLKYPFSGYVVQRAIQFSCVEILKKISYDTSGFHTLDPLFSLLPVQGDESVVFHGMSLPIIHENATGGYLDELIRNAEYWWQKNKDKLIGLGLLAGLGLGAYKLTEQDSKNGKKRK